LSLLAPLRFAALSGSQITIRKPSAAGEAWRAAPAHVGRGREPRPVGGSLTLDWPRPERKRA